MTPSRLRRSAVLVTSLAAGLALAAAPVGATPAAYAVAAPHAQTAQAAQAAPAAQAPAGSVRVKVLQYNIRFGERGLSGVAADIKRTGAQVVMLNEVDDRTRTGGRRQAQYLARKLGMSYVYDANAKTRFGLRGNAVLTSLSIVSSQKYRLPAPSRTEPRGLLKVRITHGAVSFDVWSTHFAPGRGKLAQARRTRDVVGDPACATVLGGDLNTRAGSAEYKAVNTHLRDLFAKVGSGPGGTTENGRSRIDYVMYDKVAPGSAKVAPLRHSDHRGVIGTVLVDPAKSC